MNPCQGKTSNEYPDSIFIEYAQAQQRLERGPVAWPRSDLDADNLLDLSFLIKLAQFPIVYRVVGGRGMERHHGSLM
jgi:hypothetical protein